MKTLCDCRKAFFYYYTKNPEHSKNIREILKCPGQESNLHTGTGTTTSR